MKVTLAILIRYTLYFALGFTPHLLPTDAVAQSVRDDQENNARQTGWDTKATPAPTRLTNYQLEAITAGQGANDFVIEVCTRFEGPLPPICIRN